MAVVRVGIAVRVVAIEPAIFGADPQIARTVFMECQHLVVAQTVWIVGLMSIVGELAGIRIELADSARESTDPQNLGAILKDLHDRRVRVETVGVLVTVLETSELVARRKESMQNAAPGAHPKSSAIIDKEGRDPIVGQAEAILGVVAKVFETLRVAVPAVETSVRGHPEIPVLIQRKI